MAAAEPMGYSKTSPGNRSANETWVFMSPTVRRPSHITYTRYNEQDQETHIYRPETSATTLVQRF